MDRIFIADVAGVADDLAAMQGGQFRRSFVELVLPPPADIDGRAVARRKLLESLTRVLRALQGSKTAF